MTTPTQTDGQHLHVARPVATTLPEYHEWTGSSMWRAHLLEDHIDNPVAECPACTRGHMLKDIYAAIFSGLVPGAAEICWALQDGYGVIGGEPGQHFDWSGIRDSSPAAVARMHAAVIG